MDRERLALLRAVVGREVAGGQGSVDQDARLHGEARIALRTGPADLQSFEIVGIAAGDAVFAAWDGRVAIMCQELYQRALLSLAWERLSGTGLDSEAASAVLDDPREVSMRLVGSLERVVRIEYTTRCDYSQKLHTWLLEDPDRSKGTGLAFSSPCCLPSFSIRGPLLSRGTFARQEAGPPGSATGYVGS